MVWVLLPKQRMQEGGGKTLQGEKKGKPIEQISIRRTGFLFLEMGLWMFGKEDTALTSLVGKFPQERDGWWKVTRSYGG